MRQSGSFAGALSAEAGNFFRRIRYPWAVAWGFLVFRAEICGCLCATVCWDSPFVTGVAGVVDQCYTRCAVLPRIVRGVSRKSTNFNSRC